MIDLDEKSRETVRRILREHVPECGVWVFGSRVVGSAKQYSDLDLVLLGQNKLETKRMNRLREAFADSDLPIRVDVLDWNTTSESFQSVILDQHDVFTDCASTLRTVPPQ